MPGPAAFDWCLGCGELGTLDILLNIVLFAPFGAAVALIKRGHVWMAALAAALLSGSVELAQLVVVSGRDPSFSDVVANTLGGALGAGLVRLALTRSAVAPAPWRRMAWLAAIGVCAALLVGEWSMRPHVPAAGYYVQWLPERARYAPFRGDLRRIWLESRALVPGEVLTRDKLPATLFEGRLNFRARVVPGPATQSAALIARLVTRRGELVMLGQRGHDLIARYRSNAALLRLRSPMLALQGAVVAARDSLIDVALHLEPDAIALRAARIPDGREALEQRYVMNAGRAWVMFLPGDVPVGSAGIVIDIAWVGLMFAVVAFAAARAPRRARWAPLAVSSVAAVALVAAAPAATLWNVWLGAALGSTTGLWLGARRSRQAVSQALL